MKIVVDFAEGADVEAVVDIARKIKDQCGVAWLIYGPQTVTVEDEGGAIYGMKVWPLEPQT